MQRKIFKDYIQNEFAWIYDLGFTYSTIEMAIFFKKSIGNIDYSISFSWAEYNEIGIIVVFAKKRFNVVEKIIERKTGRLGYTIKLTLDPKKLEGLNTSIVTPINKIYLSNEDDVKKFSQLVQLFYNTKAVPFYNQFDTLEDIGKWLDETDFMTHHKLLGVANNSMLFRKLIILKEINSNKFEELYHQYKNMLIEKSNAGERAYQELYETFIELEDYFQSSLT